MDSCVCARCTVQAPRGASRVGSAPWGRGPCTPSLTPNPWLRPGATCCAGLGGRCLAHLESDVVEVATAAKRGPAGLQGPVGRRVGAGTRSPGARRSGPVGGGQRGGSGGAGPLALGGLLPGHGGRALSVLPLQPPCPGPSRSLCPPGPTRTRTLPTAAAAAAASSRAPGLRPAPAAPRAHSHSSPASCRRRRQCRAQGGDMQIHPRSGRVWRPGPRPAPRLRPMPGAALGSGASCEVAGLGQGSPRDPESLVLAAHHPSSVTPKLDCQTWEEGVS
ncbi:uncharacterized protein LOC144338335 [Macaca mulatta]